VGTEVAAGVDVVKIVRARRDGKLPEIQVTQPEPKPPRHRGCPEHKRRYLEQTGKHTFVCTQCARDYGKRVVVRLNDDD
jgi:hypothetical protein